MEINQKILAVIGARSGSKGLLNKNILDCAGKPLIAWTIEAALGSGYIDRVLVSTDSREIADIAEEYGAWVPFLRSPDLAMDDSSIVDVVKDILARLSEQSYTPEYVSLLQPTSPLRTAKHLDAAVEEYFSCQTSDNDTLVSVKEVENKLLWAFGKDDASGHLYSHFDIDLENPRRQDLPKCYMPNGAIYLVKTAGFERFYGGNMIPFVMNEADSIDVDYQDDIERASEYLLSKK